MVDLSDGKKKSSCFLLVREGGGFAMLVAPLEEHAKQIETRRKCAWPPSFR